MVTLRERLSWLFLNTLKYTLNFFFYVILNVLLWSTFEIIVFLNLLLSFKEMHLFLCVDWQTTKNACQYI